MAHDLKDRPVPNVHQTLHGYADGHRLLASSTALKLRDLKTMLIMSDASGPGAVIDDAGYLTGYPLADSGFYAFARTWAATEMTRPGCVWTHTLLLDFADLALLPAMDFLADAFRRPRDTVTPTGYDSVLTIPQRPSTSANTSATSSENWRDTLRRILWALYNNPKDRVVASADENSSQAVFFLWAQQWPRLRRTFRFCTLAFADRSGEGGAFDLQFVPTRERSVRSRFSSLTDTDRLQPTSVEWLDDALSDLLEGTTGNLRTFFREVGGDLAGGREAFVPLCRLHRLVRDFSHRSSAIDEAVSLLDDSFEAESASSLRAVVVSAAASHPEVIGERGLAFVIHHLELLKDGDIEENGARLGAALWARDPEEFKKLFTEGPPRPLLAERALAALSADDLLEGLRRNPHVVSDVIARRPDLTAEPSFWTIPGSWQADAFVAAAREPNRVEAALAAMLTASRADLAADAARIFGSAQLLRAIATSSPANTEETPSATASAWLGAALVDGKALAEALSGCVVHHRALLLAIARRTTPDFVPNDFGEDPWWTAVRHAQSDISRQGLQYLSAYLLTRALGHRSRNQAELMAFALESVYFAALRSNLTDEAWALMEKRLPRSFPWLDWDRCHRIRAAIVDAFVHHELSPLAFTQVTSDDHLFAQLVEAVSWRGPRGQRFLKKVSNELLRTGRDQDLARIKILERHE